MLTINRNPEANGVIFQFDGRLDTNACQPLGEEINRYWENLKTDATPGAAMVSEIVFDLQNVRYIASAFIRLCVMCAKKVEPGKFSIIHCDPMIKKTFSIAGLDELLRVE